MPTGWRRPTSRCSPRGFRSRSRSSALRARRNPGARHLRADDRALRPPAAPSLARDRWGERNDARLLAVESDRPIQYPHHGPSRRAIVSGLKYVRFFEEIGIDDVPLVGGKNASLGEMYRNLSGEGVRVPNGFAITAEAYRHMLDTAGAWGPLHEALDDLRPDDVKDLARRAKRARDIVYGAGVPEDLAREILESYRKLQELYGEEVSLAVRSSATAEDLPTASFAGQQESYLNIHGDENLLDACRRCFASLFTDRAIHYRIDQGFDHFAIGLSIGVMKMIRSDLSASGVFFSLDTESGFRDVVFITGAYGLGENVVQGAVDPDEFYVHKPTFAAGHRVVLSHTLGRKQMRMVYAPHEAGGGTRNEPTDETERARFCITDADVLTLADHAMKIEEHYSARAGHPEPMDIEWVK